MTVTFALLHATFRRAGGPGEVRSTWLDRAADPDRVEYIAAMDADDSQTIRLTRGWRRVISEPLDGRVTSVRNWNAAAALANADVLVVVADDLFPPIGWDNALESLVTPLNPRTQAFSIKVTDDPTPDDTLLRHPIISRAFLERHGLFSPRYDGVYCDNDVTRRAFWRAVIIDGRAVVLEHRHPTLDSKVGSSESHDRINEPAQYQTGHDTYESMWSRHERRSSIRLVPPPSHRRVLRPSLRAWRAYLVATAHIESVLRASRTGLGLLVKPARLAGRVQERRTR